MGIEILAFDVAVSAFLPYANDSAFLVHLQRKAAVAMGEVIIKQAALYQRTDPKPNDPQPMIIHRWRVGVETNMHEMQARAEQMEEARRQGRAEAAAMLRTAADNYSIDNMHGCNEWVIRELRKQADKVES